MCGENPIESTFGAKVLGSPPHVRGKLNEQPFLAVMRRITPACAGKTKYLILRVLRIKDHPRMCGENQYEILKCHQQLGSPPHVRGKPYSF